VAENSTVFLGTEAELEQTAVLSLLSSAAMQALALACPHCGAPLDVKADDRVVLCIYCRGTCRIVADPKHPEGAPVAEKREVSKETTDEVIRLILDNKRAEAVALYASAAGVEPAEAETVVQNLMTSLVLKLARHLPIKWGAIPIHLVLLAGIAAGAVWAGNCAANGTPALALLAVLLLALFFFWLRSLWRHTRSRIVAAWGAQGRAQVLRTAIVRREYRRGGTLIVVGWDVRPNDGSTPFRDEETMLVKNETLPKLEPGNIVSVRLDRKRALVFPVSPVTVVGHA
jgi:uncharacterized Zn finger protein (UPF0148 family)